MNALTSSTASVLPQIAEILLHWLYKSSTGQTVSLAYARGLQAQTWLCSCRRASLSDALCEAAICLSSAACSACDVTLHLIQGLHWLCCPGMLIMAA